MLKLTQAVLASTFCALTGGVASAQGNIDHRPDLTGSWQITATIPKGTPACPGSVDCVYPALATATSDGTILQTAPISNTLTGHGSWRRVGPRNFKAHTIYFRVDPATGAFVGTSETAIEVAVASRGGTAEGTFSAAIFAVDGTQILSYSGSVTAQRIQVDK